MSDYIKYLKMAKGDAPDPLHAAILELLRQHAPREGHVIEGCTFAKPADSDG